MTHTQRERGIEIEKSKRENKNKTRYKQALRQKRGKPRRQCFLFEMNTHIKYMRIRKVLDRDNIIQK